MSHNHFHTLLLASALLAPVAAQKGPSLEQQQAIEFEQSEAWRSFLDNDGGDWRMAFCTATGTPKAIWGTGITLNNWRENTLEEARRHANQLLRDRSELLGLGPSDFREVIGARMGNTWSLVYDQYYRGLPVIDGRADVRINMVGRVAMFGSKAFDIPAGYGTVPTMLPETAAAIAWQSLNETHVGRNHNQSEAAPRLVIWGDVRSPVLTQAVLAWEVAVNNFDQGLGRVGRYYIDAHSGAVLHFANDLLNSSAANHTEHNTTALPANDAPNITVTGSGPQPVSLPTNVTVTIKAWQNRELSAVAVHSLHPMRYIDVDVQGVGTFTTDGNGRFTVNLSVPAIISFPGYDGRHHELITGSSAPALTSLISPLFGTSQTLTIGTFIDFDMNAHATASYWVDRTNEYCRNILGNSAQLNAADSISAEVNFTGFAGSGCGANYNTQTNHMRFSPSSTSTCFNASVSTIVAHEWGHGLDHQYGGVSNAPGDGLSEAWGDVVATYVVDDSEVGLNWLNGTTSVRSGNNTRLFTSLTPSTEEHDAAEVFMGFAWKLRNRLEQTLGSRATAITVSNDIVIGSIVADATNQVDALREVYLADDNDGNLFNGTPHSQELAWAASWHALPVPALTPNEQCGDAIAVTNGTNGPFTTINATASSPTWPCGSFTAKDVWFSYTTNATRVLEVSTCGLASWDTQIQVFSGSCGALTSLACNDDACSVQSRITVTVPAGTNYIRVGGYGGATGTFSLDITEGAAISTTFGSGCSGGSNAFYELMPGNGFDLSGTAMRLINNGSTYTAELGGTYAAPPSGSTTLSLGVNGWTTLNLPVSIPYPGGSTSSLLITTNGTASVGQSNGLNPSPNASAWLASTDRRWGTWHDFNELSGGTIKAWAGVNGIVYITWVGVHSNGTSDPNTWQMQFDSANGNVTYVWHSIVASGGPWLVGYATGNGDQDGGNMDLSAALPATFPVGLPNLQLSATPPQIGGTCMMTTTEVPATGIIALQTLGLTQINPGLNLGFLGMPGCAAYCSLDASYTMIPAGGVATYALSIPNQANLVGFQLTTQSSVLDLTANAFGFINSNGVLLTLDY